MGSKNGGYQEIMNQVGQMLESGHVKEAQNLLLSTSSRPSELQNALGVCWMRSGEPAKAVDLYRPMVLVEGGVSLRPEAQPNALLNYATALLLTGNVAGCEAVLSANPKLNGPDIARLRESILKWKRSLGTFRRFMIALGGPIHDAHVELDYPPGVI